jgi:magnesium transporter
VNLATAFLAAGVVGNFKGAIASVPLLAVYMSIVAGMGGNAATQTLAVIVRGIALGELTWANAWQALSKEVLVSLGNGIANGIVAAVAAWCAGEDRLIVDLRVGGGSLEDVYLELVGRRREAAP